MCGIFAYSGPRDVKEALIGGLKKLEYRGYDSAGLAFFKGAAVERFRVCGGIAELKKKLPDFSVKNSAGIGHTRWATHGAPSEKNAHPHRAGFVYVAHNGVIENEGELKQIIDSRRLLSETDTELIPHLIQRFGQEENLSFSQSALKSARLLKGSYAVVAISEKEPEEIIAFKSGPPLALFQAGGEFFISSDPKAVGLAEGKILFLEDGELVSLKKSKLRIFNFQGKKISRALKPYSQKPEESAKGHHPHFMIKEILDQPQSAARLMSRHIDKAEGALSFKLSRGDKKEFDRLLKNSSELLILACGSSYHSALFAQYFFESEGRIKARAEMASEFIYRKAVVPQGSLALFVSQSGETADILTALQQTRRLGLKSLSLCNVKDSSLDRLADFAVSMEAGPELAVASTKAFSASLLALSFLAFYGGKLKSCVSAARERELVQSALALPSYMEKVLRCDQFFLEIMEKLKSFKSFFYLGRGLYYPIALEGALKLKEIAYLHAEAYPSGEMKHGPLAMIDKSAAVLALLPYEGQLYKKSLVNLKEAKSRGAGLISIGGKEGDGELRRLSDYFLPLPETQALFHPLLALIPLQMMAYYVSRSYGYNADRPRNLAKSVTVE